MLGYCLFSPYNNQCFLFFCLKNIPTLRGTNRKSLFDKYRDYICALLVFFFDHLSNWHVWFESKTQNKGKNDHIVCCDWYQRASLGFFGRASALLFSSVWWPLLPQKVGHRGTGLCQQKDKVEMLLFMLIGSPVYRPPDWDNEMVEERSGRRMGCGRDRGNRMGGWRRSSVWSTQVSVLFDEDEVKC